MIKLHCLVKGAFKHSSEHDWHHVEVSLDFIESLNMLSYEFRKYILKQLDESKKFLCARYNSPVMLAAMAPEPDCFKVTDIEVLHRSDYA